MSKQADMSTPDRYVVEAVWAGSGEMEVVLASAYDYEIATRDEINGDLVARNMGHAIRIRELAVALREIATADYTRIDVATLGNIARAALAKAGL